MMILHMDGNIMLLTELLSFLLMIFIILFHFRGVYAVVMCFWCTRGVVLPESDVWCVFLYVVLMMKYCWNKCLNVRRGSTLSDLFTPCVNQAHLRCDMPSDPAN